MKYLDLSCNSIGDQGLQGLVSTGGWKSRNLSILKLSRINVTGLSGKNLAKLIIQLQASRVVQNEQDVNNDRRDNAMQLVDISWNNLNVIGLKAFFNTLNSFEEKVRLHFLDATWVGLQDSCLNTVLAFLAVLSLLQYKT